MDHRYNPNEQEYWRPHPEVLLQAWKAVRWGEEHPAGGNYDQADHENVDGSKGSWRSVPFCVQAWNRVHGEQ
jgi:hypothetical protein